MTAGLRRLTAKGAGVALALVVAGCGKVLEYPDEVPENSAALCSDGNDNDYDGNADCGDEDCDGFCHEESAAECSDGHDNDGDGLADAADPRCWLITRPDVLRCAEASGLELVETFDASAQSRWVGSPWFGSLQAFTDFHQGEPPEGRQDLLVAFSTPTTDDQSLAFLTRQWAFSGSWEGFELSFSASVPLGTKLRVGIAPVGLVSPIDVPQPDAAAALFSVTIDAVEVPPLLELDIEGARYSERLKSEASAEFGNVNVVRDDLGFTATLTPLTGSPTVLRVEPPDRSSLPSSLRLDPARLVLWGGSLGDDSQAALDDLFVHVSGERPCGFAAPQMPGAACDFKDELHAFGYQVSVAAGDESEDCALVTAALDPFVPDPEALTAWSSTDGETWVAASSGAGPPVSLPADAPLVGAGIAHGADGYHVVAAFHEDDGVRLGFASGATCGEWGELTPGPLLPPDAEPPSYVIVGEQHAVYFTRPPGDGTQRTLWRLTRRATDSAWLEPEELAKLSTSVESPVSVQKVGARDLVLVFPTGPTEPVAGIGVWVGNAEGRSFTPVANSPLLALSRTLRDPRDGRLAFDDFGASAAALSWRGGRGVLLYGGLSISGWDSALLSVGTARLAPAGEQLAEAIRAAGSRCGDGTCDAGEMCSSCPADCPCGAPPLLTHVFDGDSAWGIVSDDAYPAAVQYLDLAHAALNWSGASAIHQILTGDSRGSVGPSPVDESMTWSVLPLRRAIAGDFELSFDYLGNWIDFTEDAWPSCSLYVGLGTPPEVAVPGGASGATAPSGIFARTLSTDCVGKYEFRPSVHAAGTLFEDQTETSRGRENCLLERFQQTGKARRMLLRREGDQVTLGVARDDGCGFDERTIAYTGAVPELPAVLVGFGGGDFSGCDPLNGAGTITNLELRLLDDPNQCPATKELCGGGAQEPSCVDTTSSSENCGACAHACAANEVCTGGACSKVKGDVTWLTLDDDLAPGDQAPNDELGINGVFFGRSDPCATFNWDPETRCATGKLCESGRNFENWGVSVNFVFRTANGAPPTFTWDPEDVAARGVAWEISGSAEGLELWVLNMDSVWNGQCDSLECEIQGGGDGTPNPDLTGRLLFTEMTKDPWGIHYAFDPKAVFALMFKLPAARTGPESFAFCIDRLGVIR